jgi:uncharacterized protein (TIGR02265 family)
VGGKVQIRGNVLLARLAYVRKQGGADRLERVVAALTASDQKVLRGKLWDAGFYDFELNVRLDNAIAAELSPKNPDRAFLEMGRASADENLGGAHKIFVTPGDPQRFMSMAPRIYGFYYTAGRREYEKAGARAAVLKTFDAELTTWGDCLTVLGWYVRGLELCGATAVNAEHPRCRSKKEKHCEYRFSWS